MRYHRVLVHEGEVIRLWSSDSHSALVIEEGGVREIVENTVIASIAWDELSYIRVGIYPDDPIGRGLGSLFRKIQPYPVVEMVGSTGGITFTGSRPRRPPDPGRRFKHAEAAVPVILDAAAPSLLAKARQELSDTGGARFGPLTLREGSLEWNGRALARREVDSLELFEARYLTFRVMRKRKILPFGSCLLRDVPSFDVALRFAEELGFRVHLHSLYRQILAPTTEAQALRHR